MYITLSQLSYSVPELGAIFQLSWKIAPNSETVYDREPLSELVKIIAVIPHHDTTYLSVLSQPNTYRTTAITRLA